MDIMVQVLFSVAVALCYGMGQYLSKLRKGGESFRLPKMVRTLVVGAVVGVAAALGGVEITEESWKLLAVANAGAVMSVEIVLKPVLRLIGYEFSPPPPALGQ